MTSQYETETEKLNRITKMLSTFEIARDLVDTFGGATVGEALSRVEEAEKLKLKNNVHLVNVGESAVADDYQNFVKQPAMKDHVRGGGKITLMKNKSKLGFSGRPVKRTGSSSEYQDVVDGPQREFNKIVGEDRGELPWLKSVSQLHLSENAVAILKRAVARKQAIDKACREESAQRAVHNVKSRVLQRHEIEEAITPAARTILAHPLPKEASINDRLPPQWRRGGLLPAEREFNTRDMLPAEFAVTPAPKATDIMDASGRMKSPTRAGRSLDRPKPEFADTSRNDQGSISVNQPSAKPTAVANSGKKTYRFFPEKETDWDVSLRNPRKPAQNAGGNPYTGAI